MSGPSASPDRAAGAAYGSGTAATHITTPETPWTAPAHDASAPGAAAWGGRAGLLATLLLAFVLGSVGLSNDGYVTLQGDEPRHLMNGAYVHDLMVDRPFHSVGELLEYTQDYYARYPALSLGHHPPLLPLVEGPIYALLGISVFAARSVILVSFLAAALFLFLLVAETHGALAASTAAALFVTSPFMVTSARSVLTETPMVALVVMSAYFLYRFCRTEHRGALAAFVVSAAASLYAKQLAVFVWPAFLLMAVGLLGVKRMLKRDVLVAAGVLLLLVLPVVPMTLMLSPYNVTLVRHELPTRAYSGTLRIFWTAFESHLALPVLLLALAGSLRALFKGDRPSYFYMVWVASVALGLVLTGRFDPARYGACWIAPLCVLAGMFATGWRHRAVGLAALVTVLIALGVQGARAAHVDLSRAEGYEQAARYVVGHDPGPTVMFAGEVDTGFFTFFVREYDSSRRLIVLRADKILTTSMMGRPSIEERIKSPSEIYDVLRRFGTRYIVIEDRRSSSRALEWLRTELRSERFAERQQIPIVTSDHRLRGVNLEVFEFMGATPPAPDAVLSMSMPIVGRSVSVPLADLIERRHLR